VIADAFPIESREVCSACGSAVEDREVDLSAGGFESPHLSKLQW
jgi:hypothetical protein